MKHPYRNKPMAVLRRLVLSTLPPKASHWLNIQKNLRWSLLDAEMSTVRSVLEKVSASGARPRVIDVGANLGLYSQLFLDSGAEVVAIEPNPELAAYLRKIFRGKRLRVVECACSESTGTSYLNIPHLGRALGGAGVLDALAWLELTDRQIATGVRGIKTVEVKLLTLDDVCSGESQIDFIKIDVEGHELEVLRGSKNSILEKKPLIFLEVSIENAHEVFGFFESHRYSLWVLEESGSYSLIAKDSNLTMLIDRGKQNFFAVPPDSNWFENSHCYL